MKTALLILATLIVAPVAHADGLPLKDGRYPGPVLAFTLTAEQKKVIGLYRTCRLEPPKTTNMYTPYIFKLTRTQSDALFANKGFTPTVFQVYETYRGFNDSGPHWNLVLRFSADQIEVPLDLVIPDSEAQAAHEEQGWVSPNPCVPGPARP